MAAVTPTAEWLSLEHECFHGVWEGLDLQIMGNIQPGEYTTFPFE